MINISSVYVITSTSSSIIARALVYLYHAGAVIPKFSLSMTYITPPPHIAFRINSISY